MDSTLRSQNFDLENSEKRFQETFAMGCFFLKLGLRILKKF